MLVINLMYNYAILDNTSAGIMHHHMHHWFRQSFTHAETHKDDLSAGAIYRI